MAVEVTPLGFRKPDGKELVRNMDNEISANAQKAQDYLGQLLPDVDALKTLGGLQPGDVSDATMTTLANDPNSDFRGALSATYGQSLNITSPQFGVTRGTTTSQTAAIKAALDANPGKSFYFPPGDYRLDTTLVITQGNSLELAKDARIYAGAAMSVLIDYTNSTSGFVLDKGMVGGVYDGNLLAGTVVSIQNILRFTFAQFTIRDGLNRGIKAGPEGAEIIANDGRIYNSGSSNVTDNVAIEDAMGDNYWTNIIITDWTQAVKDSGTSYWHNIHPWIGSDGINGTQVAARYPTSVAFESTTQADFSACYSDTYRTAFKIRSNGTGYTPRPRFINCRAFWAPTNVEPAFANANPGVVFDNTDGVGATIDRTSTDGMPDSPVSFLSGPATNLTVRGTVNNGFTNGIAEYIDGRMQGIATFTPSLVGSATAGVPTYTGRTGRIHVDGNVARVSIRLAGTFDSTIAGTLKITGLPLASSANNIASGTVGYWQLANVTKSPVPYSAGGSTEIPLGVEGTGSLGGIDTTSLRTTVFELWVNLTYELPAAA